MDSLRGRPSIREMLTFVEQPGSLLLDSWARKPLAIWDSTHKFGVWWATKVGLTVAKKMEQK